MRLNPKVFMFVISAGVCIALSSWLGKLYFQYYEKPSSINSTGIATTFNTKENGTPSIGGPFRLIDHFEQPRTDVDFKGKFLMIYFGYSYCPDICPAALSNMSEALALLGKKAEQIQPLFITIDPERDTIAHLALYLQSFDPRILGLTGNLQEVEQAMKAYRVYGMKAKPDGTTTEYVMDHSSIIYIMDRQGRFVSHFSHTTTPQEMARIFNELIN